MKPPLPDDVRRALGLALQVLEEQPKWLQPKSNMSDMRKLLNGQDTGRDGLILTEAIAVALAMRTLHILAHPAGQDGLSNRLDEFRSLFTVVQQCDPWTFAVQFVGACDRFARAEAEAK
jgi:hypothetical protein